MRYEMCVSLSQKLYDNRGEESFRDVVEARAEVEEKNS